MKNNVSCFNRLLPWISLALIGLMLIVGIAIPLLLSENHVGLFSVIQKNNRPSTVFVDALPLRTREIYEISVDINGTRRDLRVTKEFYEKTNVGDLVKISYRSIPKPFSGNKIIDNVELQQK